MDTAAVITLELVRSAVTGRAVFLVAAILAIWVSVAAPLPVNAFARAALHLAGRTFGRRRRVVAAALWGLIRLILAVYIIVT